MDIAFTTTLLVDFGKSRTGAQSLNVQKQMSIIGAVDKQHQILPETAGQVTEVIESLSA